MSGGDGEASSSAVLADVFDGSVSPISAADMLTRSLRRTPRRTTTPSRRLFPDNIDLVAPEMTPTSRSRPKRKSTVGIKTPRKSISSRTGTSSAILESSQTPSHDPFRESRSTMRREQGMATPAATPGNRSLLRSDLSVSRGKRKSRDSEDSSVSLVANQFGAWGGRGREESPMELLRRLVTAPGRLHSPTDDGDSTAQSISQRLGTSTRESLRDATFNVSRSPLKPGLSAPGDLTRDMPPPSSRPSSSSNRDRPMAATQLSVANTSIAASDAGQGRRAARQSQANNIFSDLLDQDAIGIHSIGQTTGKPSDFPLPEDVSGSNEVDTSIQSAVLDIESLEDDSALLDELMNLTAPVSVRRFEDVETSIDQTRSQLFRRDSSNGEVERSEAEELDETDVFRTRARIDRSMDIQAAPQMGEEEESRNMFNFVNDEGEIPIEEEILDQSNDSADERLNSEGSSSDDDDDEEREEDITIDQSKEMQAARLALLRKRRIKKKAKRYSLISGNPVPCLPPSTIKGLFVSAAMPKTGLGSTQVSKGKITVDKGAVEAVEDLTHHYFGQFMQSLVTQADEKSQSSISERDILAILKSQGQISARNSLAFLARKHLPRELSDLVTSTTAAHETSGARKQYRKRPAKSLAVVQEEDSRLIDADEEEED